MCIDTDLLEVGLAQSHSNEKKAIYTLIVLEGL